jgi:hypothetical protein
LAGAIGALVLVGGSNGCGRIGYEPLPYPSGSEDATATQDAAPDSFAGGAEAEADGAALPEAGEDGAADASDGTADAACITSAVVDYCTKIPPLPAAPVIDGVVDCGPALVPFTPVGWRGAGPLPPFPPGNSASVAAAWRPDGVYVFISAITPFIFPADPTSPVYFGTAAEVFLDDDGAYANPPKYDDPGTIQAIATAPAAQGVDAGSDAATDAQADALAGAPNDSHRAALYRNQVLVGPWLSSQFGTFLTPGGFVFEGFFTAADLGLSSWTLASGQTIGFDVAVDVSYPTATMTGAEGHRASQYFFHIGSSAADAGADAARDGATDAGDAAAPLPPVSGPYVDVRSFCNPTLTAM